MIVLMNICLSVIFISVCPLDLPVKLLKHGVSVECPDPTSDPIKSAVLGMRPGCV
jgi:hypothetical protein